MCLYLLKGIWVQKFQLCIQKFAFVFRKIYYSLLIFCTNFAGKWIISVAFKKLLLRIP
jgi:hypothetical protein